MINFCGSGVAVTEGFEIIQQIEKYFLIIAIIL
uniref:Uncharacterized protein n=1 Tax=Plectus sambesii TaxID=2011161 RepID=A0A914XL67_9BILA